MPSSWPQPRMLETVIPPPLLTTTNDDNDDNNHQNQQLQQHYRVLALYKFVSPKIPKDSLKELQSEIETTLRNHHARGTLLLAEEGINGTICYPFNNDDKEQNNDNDKKKNDDNNEQDDDDGDEDDDILLKYLQTKFNNSLRTRTSYADRPIFARLKIKIKSEIVTMHWEQQQQEDNNNNICCPTKLVGQYVKPQQWNDLLLDPETMVIDTRNEYEIDVGTFRNAINPHTQSFVEFPNWMKHNLGTSVVSDSTCNNGNNDDNTEDDNQQLVNNGEQSNNDKKIPKKIAMFCTGGIRCEKATNACLQLLPDVPVYHLEGGILAYLNEIPPEQSLFDGDCYVFDQRVAVTYGLQPSTNYTKSCYGCRHPLSLKDMDRDDYIEGISCRYCSDDITSKMQERRAQRQRQMELAIQEGRKHIHDSKERA